MRVAKSTRIEILRITTLIKQLLTKPNQTLNTEYIRKSPYESHQHNDDVLLTDTILEAILFSLADLLVEQAG